MPCKLGVAPEKNGIEVAEPFSDQATRDKVNDPQFFPHEELQQIGLMLDTASIPGLEAEVVWSFGQARARGSSVGEAAAFAVSEWDL